MELPEKSREVVGCAVLLQVLDRNSAALLGNASSHSEMGAHHRNSKSFYVQ